MPRLLLILLSALAWLALGASPAGAQAPRAERGTATPLLITGARVLDPEGKRWLDNRAVLIEAGVIKRIATAGEPGASEAGGAQRIDATGLFLLPGLIDLHTHLLLRSYDRAKWDDQVLKESLELRTIRGVAAAKATLDAGFTTIRDLGTEGAAFADVALRDAVNAGIIPGPRIVAVTRAIVATGGYGPMGFDPRWDVPKGAQVADGVDGVRKAVREQIAAGADWIKVYADYRRTAGAPATATFSEDELRAAVEEARSAGKRVSAHATTDEGVRRAVLAGVATVEHGYGASRETFQLMKDKGVVLCPTMAAAEAIARYGGWRSRSAEAPGVGEPPVPAGVAQSRASLKLAREVGVTIACGSDAGVFAHGENVREMELMVAAGMSPVEALGAATSGAAKVLGMEHQIGSMEEGFIADLVLVRGDPLADIGALRSIVWVIKGGVVEKSSR